MKTYINDSKILATVIAMIALFSSSDLSAQKFAVNVHDYIGLGSPLNLKPTLDFDSKKSSGNEFGVDFGWRFWQKNNLSLQANIGLGYRNLSTDIALSKLDYSYSAPATADMDDETYIRYYELKDLKQKCKVNQLTIPVYLTYGYQCTDWLAVHADLGLKFGINAGSKVSGISGSSFSYGVYPQYDNLMIDAGYLNDFGEGNIAEAAAVNPEASSLCTSLLVGVGAEFKIYGPISADLSVRYENGFNDVFKSEPTNGNGFTSTNAPVTYTVADGTVAKPLTNYFKTSKLSQLALGISLNYRF